MSDEDRAASGPAPAPPADLPWWARGLGAAALAGVGLAAIGRLAWLAAAGLAAKLRGRR